MLELRSHELKISPSPIEGADVIRLPDPGKPWRQILSRIPAPSSGRFYIVGGWVRDLLLMGPHSLGADIDLAIDSDLSPWARSVADALGADLHLEPDFLTARIILPWENERSLRIDMSRFRKERYEHPGGLPQVSPGTISDDARRRDFTMNAIFLEWSATQGKVTDLFDPHGGRDDLKKGLIHPIFNDTFREDPIRLFRWARLSVRLGLNSSPSLLNALERSVRCPDLWDYVGGARVQREMERLFDEQDSLEILKRLFSFQIVRSLGGRSRLSSIRRLRLRRWRMFRETLKGLDPVLLGVEALDREMFFLALLHGSSREEFRILAEKIGISERMRDRLGQVLYERKGWPFSGFYEGFEKMTNRDPGKMRAIADRTDLIRVAYLVLIGREGDLDFWGKYLSRDRWTPPLLGGEELLKYPGIPPSLRGAILAELRMLQRTGVLKDPGEARLWLKGKVSAEFP